MVDLSLLQSVSYIAGAFGVCVAAFYYVMNLRISQRNQEQTLETRKLQFVTGITNQLNTEEGHRRYGELMNMEWKDYDDFERKYGSENNAEAASRRYATWNSYNEIGSMLRKGIVEADDLYDTGANGTIFVWAKYKPVVEEIRRRYLGQGYLTGFEYLAGEMLRVARKRDPSYSIPETLNKYLPDKKPQ
ncbi:MAG: hypothetical protein NTY03_00635 [Candidatus Bathyarchaeota archaeon]|nr:hypothetical protein [Candidatus Bathyarchaeota archaeon]